MSNCKKKDWKSKTKKESLRWKKKHVKKKNQYLKKLQSVSQVI